MLVDQVPNQNKTIVSARSEDATSVRGPFHAVQRSPVALKFQKSLAGLPHVQDANNAGVLRESGEKMGIVWRC